MSNIPAGTYKLQVTDNLGCITNLNNVVVAQPTEIVIGIAKTDLNCASLDDGSITVTPSGGVAPYTYTWSDLGNGPNRKDLAAGTYTVKVTDKNLCEKSVNVVIADAPLFRIDPIVTPITCFGADDGTISLNLQGGTGNVNVLWTDDATAGVNRTGLKAGSYFMCSGCRKPISPKDKKSKKYEEGVSCPNCHDNLTDTQKARFRMRQKQINLAKKIGSKHIFQKEFK